MKLTKSHPVARALRAGKSMKAAWAAYRGGGGSRRRRGRRSRNPLIATLRNGPMASIKSIVPTAKRAISMDNVKKGAAIGGTIIASWVVPQKFFPAYAGGWKGVAATLGTGVLTSIAIGLVSPSLAPLALASAVGAAVLQVGLPYAQGLVGDFLTLKGLGQIPAGLISGGSMGDFMTTKKPFAALPAAGLGGGQKFSKVF